MSAAQIKALYRQYPDGEVIALLPEEPGDPNGTRAVGYTLAGKHQPVDVDAVLSNTAPASAGPALRVKKALQDAGFEVEDISIVPPGATATRRLNGDRHALHGRIGRMYRR